MKDIDWDDLISSIAARKCVVFLGPGIYTDQAGKALEDALFQFMESWDQKDEYVQRYYQQDDFLSLAPGSKSRRMVVRRIREFFEQPLPEAEAIFRQLAQVRLPLVISLTPDNIFSKILWESGVVHHPYKYVKNQPPADQIQQLPDEPVVYRFLGYLDDEEEAMILTHEDFYSYLDSITTGESMDIAIRETLQKADYLIFLGLPFDKWYTQLLLRAMQKHAGRDDFERYAADNTSDEVRVFYKDLFNIEFVSSDIAQFVAALVQACDKKKLLRTLQGPVEKQTIAPLDFQDLPLMVGRGEEKVVLEWLVNFLSANRLQAHPMSVELLILQGRLEKANSARGLNLISFEEFNREIANISYGLLAQIPKVEENFGHLIQQNLASRAVR